MAHKLIKIVAEEPLSIAMRKPYGQFHETLLYIPAVTLRGAFAAVLLADCEKVRNSSEFIFDHSPHGCLFSKLFGEEEKIKFSDCYPVYPKYIAENYFAVPKFLPQTAVSCKYHPGFITGYHYYKDEVEEKQLDEPPHGVFDVLIKQLIYDEIDEPKCVCKHKCQLCDEPVEPFSGHYQTTMYINLETEAEYTVHFQKDAKTHRLGRAAMNRWRWTAEEGMLYAIEVISEGTVFLGTLEIDCPDDLMSETVGALNRIQRVGGQLTRGMGRIWIELSDDTDFSMPDADAIKERIEDFNQSINTQRGTCHEGQYFTIGLQSDAILHGVFGEPKLQLDTAMLKEYINSVDSKLNEDSFENAGIKLVRAYTGPTYRSGWSTAWKLPKEVYLSTSKGSVFLYWVKNPNCELYEFLAQLEREGIGEKREEFLGRILVCDQFHLEVEPK